MNKKALEKENIFIGAAWPYANGSLHLGRVSSLLGADIIARYYRLKGHGVLLVSGSDCHGTPIAVEAEKQKISPEEISEKYHKEFVKNLIEDLKFSYDLYTKTTTKNHREVVQDVFLTLHKKGYIYPKTEKLPYCSKCERFLPDRYIEGGCPFCDSKNARGDQCDDCGKLLDPSDLISPACKTCGEKPEWKDSEHFFFKLSAFEEKLKKWVEKNNKNWRANSQKVTLGLINQGLKDRAITRDTEWGVPIPLPGYENKKIYVWFEAVSGYLSASKEWALSQNNKNAWQDFWTNNSIKAYYVHGKDNILFHTIIWPAILLAYDEKLHLPDYIISSEYLNLEKKQFSTSREWAVWLPDFLAKFETETLRYFLVVNGPETSDTNFSWTEYFNKTNGELIGTFGNLVNRTLSLIKNNFSEGVGFPKDLSSKEKELLDFIKESFVSVGEAINKGQLRKGLQIIFKLAEAGNLFIDKAKPWVSVKENKKQAEKDLAVIGHLIENLAILINPYLPTTSEKIVSILGKDKKDLVWEYPEPKNIKVEKLETLFRKIEESEIEEALHKKTVKHPN